jgi:hypothetical protein
MADMMKTSVRWTAVAVALMGAVACNDTNLGVVNPNSGESSRVLGTPNDAEALLGTYYKRWSTGVYGSTTDLQGMANVQSLMNYSSLAIHHVHRPLSSCTTHMQWSGTVSQPPALYKHRAAVFCQSSWTKCWF